MNAGIRFKDKRLLEALEYIDEKYIDDVFDFLKEPAYSKGEQTKISSFKRWRHYLAAAVCLLVLVLATPLFTHLPEIINSFAAGWGDGTETLEVPETTNGMYDEYILTEDDLAQINEAYLQNRIADLLEDGCEVSEEDIERMKNSKYSKYASTVEEAMRRNIEIDFYFGKYDNCFIFHRPPSVHSWNINPIEYVLGEYKFAFHGGVHVIYEYEWLRLSEAYERGLLSEESVAKLYEVYCNYYKK